MLNQTDLLQRFHYCPDTGNFVRLTKTNSRKPAGTLNSCGYVRIVLNGKAYLAHRLAWLYTYGIFPTHDIDHINGVRSDNRLTNLRDVPRVVNAGNRTRANKNNVHGTLGVTPLRDKWVAQLRTGASRGYLGIFDTVEEATQAYANAKQAQEGAHLADN